MGPVNSLKAVWINSSLINVTFIPPDTLDGVLIRYYTIELYDSEDSQNSTTYNTTETQLLVDGYNACSYINHSVNVSAWNDVGEGEIAMMNLNRGT